MTWFRCPCGYIAEVEAVAGEIVSVYHLHTDTHPDKQSQRSLLSRMEPLPDPVPEPALVAAGASHR